MPDCKAEAMEKFSASKERPKELCLSKLKDSNILLLIFGFKYGSIDLEEYISFTEIEYNAATEIGKLNLPIFVFQKQRNGEWISEEEDNNINQKLLAFKSRLDEAHVWAPFETIDKLLEEVFLVLYNEKVEREKLNARLKPLISYKEFFKPFLNENNYFNHTYSLVGREDYLKDLNNFLFSDNKIAIVPGRGGIGKSRILYEFSRLVKENINEWDIAFVNEHIPVSKDTFTKLPAEKIVLVLDDAHRRNEYEIALLLDALQFYKEYKIIISSRPYGLNYIRNALNKAGIDHKKVENLSEIKELQLKDLQKLGFEVLGEEYQDLINPLIQVAKDSPLVMVVGGNLIKEKKLIQSSLNAMKNSRIWFLINLKMNY